MLEERIFLNLAACLILNHEGIEILEFTLEFDRMTLLHRFLE